MPYASNPDPPDPTALDGLHGASRMRNCLVWGETAASMDFPGCDEKSGATRRVAAPVGGFDAEAGSFRSTSGSLHPRKDAMRGPLDEEGNLPGQRTAGSGGCGTGDNSEPTLPAEIAALAMQDGDPIPSYTRDGGISVPEPEPSTPIVGMYDDGGSPVPDRKRSV